jgi:DNA repair protein RadC
MTTPLIRLAKERAEAEPICQLSDDDLVRAVLGTETRAGAPLAALARSSAAEVSELLGITLSRAARLVSAFELGRRGAWCPPSRGARCLDPVRVHDVMRDIAFEDVEEFHVVLLDVRGRLLGRRLISRGSLSQCPVSPRDVMRAALREGAHSIVFVHNHPSGDPTPSPDDVELTERLRAAAELVGVLARDHVIVATGGYYSFAEAGRWRR